jgi:hypothetical protein
MNTKDEALKLALEALESYGALGHYSKQAHKAITAIKQALAAPVPLTDEQIDQIIKTAPRTGSGYVGWILDQRRVWARAIEAAHGITKV